ncbi:TolB family protein [Flagellimonas sp.]|uniref:TolB family protein n=1 Tax=Flagellimonas sp. TaxID=2058762 RepID=UPI003B52935F
MDNPRKLISALLVLGASLCIGCTNPKGIVKFEPGNISTKAVEYACTFSSDGKEIYFARSEQAWGSGDMKSAIYRAEKKNGTWSTPKVASFSGVYDDSDPHLTKDGNTLYFVSNRPSANATRSADIWTVTRNERGSWGKPSVLSYPINSEKTEYSPRTDGEGNLYFASDRPDGYGQGDLYVSKLKDEEFQPPINMGSTLNSPFGEWNLEVNLKGDLIIFEASQRDTNVSPYGDFYISFKQDNAWTQPQNMVELNTSGSDLYPYLTKDGKYLYYTSSDSLKGKSTHIYVTEFRKLRWKYKQQSNNLKD